MKQQDKLKKTLQEYYDTQESPYNEHEWERASLYLAEARRKRKLRFAAILVTVLLSGLLITLIYYPESTAGPQVSAIPAKQSDPKPTVPAKANSLQETKVVPPSGITEKVSPLTSVPVTATIKTPGLKVLTSAADAPHLSGSLIRTTGLMASEDKMPAGGISSDPAVLHPVVKDDGSGTAVDNNTKPIAMQSPTTSSGTAPVENTSSAANLYQVPVNEVIPVLNGTPGISGPPLASIEMTKKPDLPDSASWNSIPKNTLAVPDTSAAASMAEPGIQDSIPGLTGKPAGEGFFYEAGAAGLYGWKTAGSREAQGISPFVGISYMNRLSDRCALSFGIGYLQVNNLSGSSKTSRVSTFMYGEQSKVTVITPSSARYILAPLRFQYYADHKNRFGIGLNLAYLLTVEAKVTSYDEKPGYTGNYKTLKRTGYTDGFSWFDSQLAFVYARNIGKAFGLQAEVFIGLTDVKQDAFFNLPGKEKNSGAKLSLVYYVFRKNNR